MGPSQKIATELLALAPEALEVTLKNHHKTYVNDKASLSTEMDRKSDGNLPDLYYNPYLENKHTHLL